MLPRGNALCRDDKTETSTRHFLGPELVRATAPDKKATIQGISIRFFHSVALRS